MKLLAFLSLILFSITSELHASSVVFSRDVIIIRSVTDIPTTTVENEGTEAATADNNENTENPENTEALQNTTIQNIRNHEFVVTIRNAERASADWITGSRDIRKNFGILSVYEHASIPTIAPDNTETPYDIVFIDNYGYIRTIAKDIVLAELIEPLRPTIKSKAMLFIAGGTADTLAIKLGDRAIHPIFPDKPNVVSE